LGGRRPAATPAALLAGSPVYFAGMNRLFSTIVTLTWGLWLGSLAGVTLAVIAVAKTFPPGSDARFAQTAPPIFALYERVQLGLAALTLIVTFLWRLQKGAAGLKNVLFGLFALGTVAAVVEATYVAPRINHLRSEDKMKSAEFDQAHKLSERLYGGTMVLLLAGGVVLVSAIARDAHHRGRLDANR
jgi:hypothetical protein